MQRDDGTFETTDGRRLYWRAWSPGAGAKASVAIVHGYAEHLGRYTHVAEHLTRHGYAVHALDLRGHGRSPGPRALVRSFDEYLDDVDRHLELVRARSDGRPLYLLGHSMGGTLAALSAVTRPPDVRGLLLSGAGLKAPEASRWLLRVMLVLGRVAPRLRLRALDAAAVSRDPEVVARYDADPLVYRGKMPAGTLAAMLRAIRVIDQRMSEVSLPLLLMHGTEDSLTSPEGSRLLHERASSADKTLKLYEGLYHEILNEPERDAVLGDIVAWLDARAGEW